MITYFVYIVRLCIALLCEYYVIFCVMNLHMSFIFYYILLFSMSRSTVRRRNNQVLETTIQEPEKKEAALIKQLNDMIDCPRCGDVMDLSSEFDHLLYYCDSCRLGMDIN